MGRSQPQHWADNASDIPTSGLLEARGFFFCATRVCASERIMKRYLAGTLQTWVWRNAHHVLALQKSDRTTQTVRTPKMGVSHCWGTGKNVCWGIYTRTGNVIACYICQPYFKQLPFTPLLFPSCDIAYEPCVPQLECADDVGCVCVCVVCVLCVGVGGGGVFCQYINGWI